tara:strand:+ start:13986 stop:14789 length:804 start_codon:yes stop_codon:yes gene_type:complete
LLSLEKKFIELKNSNRIWAIGSIHGNLKGLVKIHNHISKEFKKNDKIVYLGNVIGVGNDSSKVIDEILRLRVFLMANFNFDTDDVIFLRGAQEEMWLKLLELHISPNPKEVIDWMFAHGVDKTMQSYGLFKEDLIKICNLDTVAISKWTKKAKSHIESYKGHRQYYSSLTHAAFSESKKILFVNRGVDISRPLSAQSDCFWWGYHGLSEINKPYYNYIKIVRGYDPKKIGPESNKMLCSLYKGSGFGEYIVAGLFSGSGDTLDLFEG